MGLAEFIVTFREFFEIFLVLGILAVYLEKTNNRQYLKFIYVGVGLAALASLTVGLFVNSASAWFETVEPLFEGITLVTTAALVSWLLVWLFKQQNVAKSLERGLQQKIDVGSEAGVIAFSFIAVFREGFEVVLFLNGIAISAGSISVITAAAGAVAALALSYLLFTKAIKLNLASFLQTTTIVLVLLAAGLLSQGVHELEEAGVLPPLIEHVYDLGFVQNADGSYPLMAEKGAVGALLKGLIGYDTNPSLLQLIAYFGYLGVIYALNQRYRK